MVNLLNLEENLNLALPTGESEKTEILRDNFVTDKDTNTGTRTHTRTLTEVLITDFTEK